MEEPDRPAAPARPASTPTTRRSTHLSVKDQRWIQVEADVYDAHVRWALLRYLGIFEATGLQPPKFGLSAAGRRVAGNQRRVMSEELGIGYASLLSGSWLIPDTAFGSNTVTAVDIDLLLAGIDGNLRTVQVGIRRPDYLIVGRDSSSNVKLGLLECKGTKSRHYAVKQLAAASEQLAGVTINSQTLPGLAVSSIVGGRMIEYRAVQRGPGGRAEQISSGDPMPSGQDSVYLADTALDFMSADEVPHFSSADESVADAGSFVDGLRAITGPALATSWSLLADLSGNEEAVSRWRTSRARDQIPRGRRPRVERLGPNGSRVRGVSSVLSLPGGQLEATISVVDYVDEALSNGDAAAILAAQDQAAAEQQGRSARIALASDDAVAAYGRDGSALLLQPR